MDTLTIKPIRIDVRTRQTDRNLHPMTVAQLSSHYQGTQQWIASGTFQKDGIYEHVSTVAEALVLIKDRMGIEPITFVRLFAVENSTGGWPFVVRTDHKCNWYSLWRVLEEYEEPQVQPDDWDEDEEFNEDEVLVGKYRSLDEVTIYLSSLQT